MSSTVYIFIYLAVWLWLINHQTKPYQRDEPSLLYAPHCDTSNHVDTLRCDISSHFYTTRCDTSCHFVSLHDVSNPGDDPHRDISIPGDYSQRDNPRQFVVLKGDKLSHCLINTSRCDVSHRYDSPHFCFVQGDLSHQFQSMLIVMFHGDSSVPDHSPHGDVTARLRLGTNRNGCNQGGELSPPDLF